MYVSPPWLQSGFSKEKSPKEELFSLRDSTIMVFPEVSIQTLLTYTPRFIKKLTQYRESWKAQPDFLLIFLLVLRRQLFPTKKIKKKKPNHGQFKRSSLEKLKTYGNTGRTSDHRLFKVSICKVMLACRLPWPDGTQQISPGAFAWPRVPADGANPNSPCSREKIVSPH